VRNGPVSSRVALLLRSAEGKPSFASISQCLQAIASGAGEFFSDVGALDGVQGRQSVLVEQRCLLPAVIRV
jgi:hypothetical protein